ncbi:MAG: cytochrome c oxidase subunit III, cytochrome c oxidase subunit III [Deltaproteobacteria bacterium CSP1-8]|nr:MAG: cytochrome c oxidase subunit III, cytochrome c oxidase subunit III [Deltaproteobacteria bacterium CSP1-8]
MSGEVTHKEAAMTGHEPHMDPATAREAATLGIWTFLATEVLLFGGLFTAYVIFRIKYPRMFYEDHLMLDRVLGAVNTIVLIGSSLTVALGISAIRKGKVRLLRMYLSFTILLAATFLGIKYLEYTEKFSHGLSPGTDIFFSLYFMLTGLHGIHVLAGMVVLGAVLYLAGKGKYSESYHTPVEISGLYWHFVDLVWIYLFPLLYLVG